jgi:thiol-disulfide isomerase/thioredoxin
MFTARGLFMHKKISALLFVVMLVFSIGCTKRDQPATAGSAPNFTLEDIAGNAVNLADLKGKVVMLDFWATWCPPCRASIPGLERLHRTYGPKGLVILAISLDQGDWDSVKSFLTEYGITYTVLKGTEEVSDRYMVRSIPMIVMVDREGSVRKRLIGYGVEEEVEKEIKALL